MWRDIYTENKSCNMMAALHMGGIVKHVKWSKC